MATCEFCKNTIQDKMPCPYCGTVIAAATATFVYGQTHNQTYGCEIRVTNKYIIVRSVSKKELAATTGAAAGGGILGALIAGGINGAIKKCYGYYDLVDVQKAIFPYHNNSYKKDTAIKIINKDGTDFIIHFNLNGLLFSAKTARTFAEGLTKAGVYVENGSASNYGHIFCAQPFVNENTFGTRVCQSAASFVQLDQRQFVAPSNTAAATSTPYQTVPQMSEPQVSTVNQNSANTDNQVSAASEDAFVKQPVAPAQVAKICPGCGKQLDKLSRFCSNCGHAFTDIESTNETNSVPEWNADQWKNQW